MRITFKQLTKKAYFYEHVDGAQPSENINSVAEGAANIFPIKPTKDKVAPQKEARRNKLREQAKKNFAGAIKMLGASGLSRKPQESYGDWLARVPDAQAALVRKAMLECVKAEGIPIHRRDSGPGQPGTINIDELFIAYNKFLGEERKRESALSYDTYRATHPVFQSRGNMQFAPSSPEVVYEPASTPSQKSVETKMSTTHRLTAFIGLDKGEDSVAIATDAQGRVNIAIADGVSNSVVPVVASREAALTAVDGLGNNKTPEEVFREVHDHIQELDIPTYARTYRQSLVALHLQDPSKGIYHAVTKIDDEIKEGHYAATTLGIVQYNPATGECIGRLKSDTSLAVIRKDGRFEIIENPDMSRQFMYEANSVDSAYHSDLQSEAAINLQLGDGDIAILFSDGLKLTKDPGMKDKVLLAAGYATQTGARGDSIVTNVLRTLITDEIKRVSIPDDISFVVLQHRNQVQTT